MRQAKVNFCSALRCSQKTSVNGKLLGAHYYPITYRWPQDIYIAGYPKSGNTWMQQLISGLIFGIDTELLPDRLSQDLIPDIQYKKNYKRYLDFAVFKTHVLPSPTMQRVIHLVRDGRDVMLSYYAMHRNAGRNVSLEEMIVRGRNLTPAKWYVHTRKWLDNPYSADMITVRYEDLLSDPKQSLNKIADFMKINRTQEQIEKIVSGCRFEKMQEKEQTYGLENPNWPKSSKFFRKGSAGSYRDELDDTLKQYFETEAHDCLVRLGYPLSS
jgi:hypothetical protein